MASKRKVYKVVRVRPLTSALASRQVVRVCSTLEKAETAMSDYQSYDHRNKYEVEEFG
jgi:hypothetical protein